MAEDRTQALLADIAEALQATEELPVERTAARWIGEAQAVATDLTRGEPAADTVRRRVGQVVELLDNVEDTGHPEADERVDDAKAAAREALERLDS
ncbi:MAG: hypothetical protein V5A39_15110 [Haloarculaceae archaeon]